MQKQTQQPAQKESQHSSSKRECPGTCTKTDLVFSFHMCKSNFLLGIILEQLSHVRLWPVQEGTLVMWPDRWHVHCLEIALV